MRTRKVGGGNARYNDVERAMPRCRFYSAVKAIIHIKSLFVFILTITVLRCLVWNRAQQAVVITTKAVCPGLENPANGGMVVTGGNPGDTATYYCGINFELVGADTLTCGSDGMWSPDPPVCRQAVTCPNLENPANGAVMVNGMNPGDTATYVCISGYELVGADTLTCESDGMWSADLPVCTRATISVQHLKEICTRTFAKPDKMKLSSSWRIMNHNMKALQEFVPQNFSQKYRNPCWTSALQIPLEASEHFENLKLMKYPVFTKVRATSIVNRSKQSLVSKQSPQRLYCLPSVHIAAFPKCGTTTLYKLIIKNPMMAKPLRKEGLFWSTFTEEGAYVDKQIHSLWYLHKFLPAADQILYSPQKITIDGSPTTLFNTSHEPRIDFDVCIRPSLLANLVPDTRLIVIMREPVNRLFSDFWYFCSHRWGKYGRWGEELYVEHAQQIFHKLTVHAIDQFRSCMDAGVSEFVCVHRATRGHKPDEKYCYPVRVGVGLYYYHVIPWLATYPREKLLFLRSEDLAADPYLIMQRVWDFLDIPAQSKEEMGSEESYWNNNDWIRSEENRDKFAMLPETEQLLYDFYKPYNQLLVKLLSDDKYLWEDAKSQPQS